MSITWTPRFRVTSGYELLGWLTLDDITSPTLPRIGEAIGFHDRTRALLHLGLKTDIHSHPTGTSVEHLSTVTSVEHIVDETDETQVNQIYVVTEARTTTTATKLQTLAHNAGIRWTPAHNA